MVINHRILENSSFSPLPIAIHESNQRAYLFWPSPTYVIIHAFPVLPGSNFFTNRSHHVSLKLRNIAPQIFKLPFINSNFSFRLDFALYKVIICFLLSRYHENYVFLELKASLFCYRLHPSPSFLGFIFRAFPLKFIASNNLFQILIWFGWIVFCSLSIHVNYSLYFLWIIWFYLWWKKWTWCYGAYNRDHPFSDNLF